MSASEKLKMLIERAVLDRYDTIEQSLRKYGENWPAESTKAQSALYAALPQIVAVVDAAEKHESMKLLPNNGTLWKLEAALVALDEALS